MLGGISGVNPSEVVILGAGTAAEYAARPHWTWSSCKSI